MPLAVTHVLTSVILVDLFRDYITKHKHYFTLHTIFLAGLGGLLPDIDVPLGMFFQKLGFTAPWLFNHGGITHTPLFAFIFILPGLYLWKQKKHQKAMYFFVITYGVLLHITLDWFLGGGAHTGIMWLFPFSTAGWKIGLLGKMGLSGLPQALDAIILLAWLWHEERKHKISDFI